MLMKVVIAAVLAVGVLGKYEFGEKEQDWIKQIIRQTCKKNDAEDKSDQATASLTNFVNCLKPEFNSETIKNEIQEARPKGGVNEIIKKYCAKTPQLKTCIDGFIDGLYPCLSTSIREHVNADKNATNNFVDLVCANDGEKLVLFFSEGGFECLKEKDESIRNCVNKLQEGVTEDVDNVTIDMVCGRFSRASTCVAKALKECPSQTPNNIAESFFTYIKNNSPCKNI